MIINAPYFAASKYHTIVSSWGTTTTSAAMDVAMYVVVRADEEDDEVNDNDARHARDMIKSCGVLHLRCCLFVVEFSLIRFAHC